MARVTNSVVARQAAPQYKNVLEAYQKGGLRAATGMVLNAPDPGIGPMAVIQKAGAPPLRALLNTQTLRSATKRFAENPEMVQDTMRSFGGRQYAAETTPMVQTTLQRIRDAQTGKPVSLVGHRVEARSGPVPGRGTFFSAKPSGAASFDPLAATGKVRPRRDKHGIFYPVQKRVDPIQFKNPFVVERHGGTQNDLLTFLGTEKRLPPNARRTLLAIARQGQSTAGERWYTRADKAIARALKALGHDGLIYKDTNEIIDFAGTVKKGTQPTATKAVEKAAKATESNIEKGPRFPRQF